MLTKFKCLQNIKYKYNGIENIEITHKVHNNTVKGMIICFNYIMLIKILYYSGFFFVFEIQLMYQYVTKKKQIKHNTQQLEVQ